MRQLVLDVGVAPVVARANWLVTEGVRKAMDVVEGDARCVCLYGPEGSGKSHLLVMAEAKGAVVGDNVDGMGEDGQERLFHAFNAGKRVVVASRVPVAQVQGLLPDLKSRLLTGLQVEVLPPTDEELRKLLGKLARSRQLQLPKAVLDYVLVRAGRSTHELVALVEKLDVLSLEEKRAITVPLAKRVLEEEGLLG